MSCKQNHKRPFDNPPDMISNESDSSATENLTSSAAGGGSSKANYWRSVSELRGEAEFNEYLDREFPVAASSV